MFGKRCQLCGGKLENNICTECGLDNSKSDKNYKLNESSCDYEPLTHVHTENEPKQSKMQRSELHQNKVQHVKKSQKAGEKQKGISKVFIVIIIIVFLMGNMDFLLSDFDEMFGIHEVWPGSETSWEEDNYEYVTRPLSDEGEEYKIDLEQGTYIVGVHIPEGKYDAIERREETFDGFYLEDEENNIYFGESFQDDESVEIIEDIRCYAGAKLSIRGKVTFVTPHAQKEKMIALDNPLTEPVSVRDGAVAGVEFPAGTYDVVMQEGDTSFAYVVPGTVWTDSDLGEEQVTERLWIDTADGEFVERNLYLPEGTKILIDTGEVNLVPSLKIPESYEGYYTIIN